ncbi:hypothetical protein CRI94_02300 [Longibacter salinarum]|uniref:Uncharacterized protein n=1 Tax=Longibacter salinarum TaxID=1850348 RepID=A0A2A8D3D1_9BACT|nr:hypothetical protein [Longibacter salinarum]PEN15138.1 hypothetical protein CRI94_02300 [Longibacter salinarum]
MNSIPDLGDKCNIRIRRDAAISYKEAMEDSQTAAVVAQLHERASFYAKSLTADTPYYLRSRVWLARVENAEMAFRVEDDGTVVVEAYFFEQARI